jgi:hypothetical protein
MSVYSGYGMTPGKSFTVPSTTLFSITRHPLLGADDHSCDKAGLSPPGIAGGSPQADPVPGIVDMAPEVSAQITRNFRFPWIW